MHAITLLERQHESLSELLREFRASLPGDERASMFKKLQRALLVHMLLEEEIFYPTVVNHTPDGQPFAEGYAEHAATRLAMNGCAGAMNEEELFQLRVTGLEDMLSHHVAGERRSMFFAACEIFDSTELEVIGQTMQSLIERVIYASMANVELDISSTARELRARHA
jgi:hypothetical protein